MIGEIFLKHPENQRSVGVQAVPSMEEVQVGKRNGKRKPKRESMTSLSLTSKNQDLRYLEKSQDITKSILVMMKP